MRKIRLELDTLAVESFAPSHEPARGGTVGAHSGNDESLIPCTDHTLYGGASCGDVSCQETCGQAASCGYHPCGTYWEGCRGYISNYPDACVPIDW
jgi:hypothetical protein